MLCPFIQIAGAFVGLMIAAKILRSLVIDKFGWFGMDAHPMTGWRILGGILLVTGVTKISRF